MFDPTPYLSVLQSFATSVSAGAVLDLVKAWAEGRKTGTLETFRAELDSVLVLHRVNVSADTLINAFASKGLLSIQGSQLFAKDQIVLGASQGAQFIFGDSSRSETSNTAIVAGSGAVITGSNAAIVQNPDGSISFYVGSEKPKS